MHYRNPVNLPLELSALLASALARCAQNTAPGEPVTVDELLRVLGGGPSTEMADFNQTPRAYLSRELTAVLRDAAARALSRRVTQVVWQDLQQALHAAGHDTSRVPEAWNEDAPLPWDDAPVISVTLPLDRMPPLHAQALTLSYGLTGGGRATTADVGHQLGLSREGARTVLKQAERMFLAQILNVATGR